MKSFLSNVKNNAVGCLASAFLLISRPLFAENALLGVPYTMPGQEATIMLFTATPARKATRQGSGTVEHECRHRIWNLRLCFSTSPDIE